MIVKETRPDTGPIRSGLQLGRGSHAGGQMLKRKILFGLLFQVMTYYPSGSQLCSHPTGYHYSQSLLEGNEYR